MWLTTEIYGKEFYLAHGDGLGDPDKKFKLQVPDNPFSGFTGLSQAQDFRYKEQIFLLLVLGRFDGFLPGCRLSPIFGCLDSSLCLIRLFFTLCLLLLIAFLLLFILAGFGLFPLAGGCSGRPVPVFQPVLLFATFIEICYL